MTPTRTSDERREMLLAISFICSSAELSEAQSVLLRHRLGGGSRWRTWVVLLLILGGLVFKALSLARQMAGHERLYWGALLVLIWVVLFVRLRIRNRRNASTEMRFYASGFSMNSNKGNLWISWNSISRVIDAPLSVLLQSKEDKDHCFIVPRRALPTPDWIPWLSGVVEQAAQNPPQIDSSTQNNCIGRDTIPVTIDPTFANAVKTTLASSGTWFAVYGWVLMQLSVSVTMSLHPDPSAIVPMWKVFICFVVPAMFIGAVFFVFVFSVFCWLKLRTKPPTEIELSEDEVILYSGKDRLARAWPTFTRFKESPWSFVIGGVFNTHPIMIPKSQFAGPAALDRCRQMLARNLPRAAWFY